MSRLWRTSILVSLGVVLGVGCSTITPVRVLEKGETKLSASIGGPIVPGKSPTLIIPYTTVGIAHGVSESVTLHGSVAPSIAFFKILGIDIGATTHICAENGLLPEITLGADVLGIIGFGKTTDTRFYPTVRATASYKIDSTLVYCGSHATYQYTSNTSEILMSPYFGAQFPLSLSVSLQTEILWQASNISTRSGVFEGRSSVGGYGSLGIFVGALFRL